MITQEQLKDILDRTDKLRHYLRIDERQVEFEEEELRTQAPDFWQDPKRAEEQMKKVKDITAQEIQQMAQKLLKSGYRIEVTMLSL